MYNDVHNPKPLELACVGNAPSHFVSRCSNILCIMRTNIKCMISNENEINGSYSLVSKPDSHTYFTTETIVLNVSQF